MSKTLPTSHPLVRAVLRSLKVIMTESDELVIAELVTATLPNQSQDSQADQHVSWNNPPMMWVREMDINSVGGVVSGGGLAEAGGLNSGHKVTFGGEGACNHAAPADQDPVLDSALKALDRANEINGELVLKNAALKRELQHATGVAEKFCSKYVDQTKELETSRGRCHALYQALVAIGACINNTLNAEYPSPPAAENPERTSGIRKTP